MFLMSTKVSSNKQAISDTNPDKAINRLKIKINQNCHKKKEIGRNV